MDEVVSWCCEKIHDELANKFEEAEDTLFFVIGKD